MRHISQSTTRNVMVLMVQSADHITGLTGATLTITLSKNGGAFGSISPTVTERGTGFYNVALSATDTDTLGDLALHITAASADPTDLLSEVIVAPLDAAGIRSAVGLAGANLDTQLSTDATKLDEVHKIHGLASGTDLVVTSASRVAGSISQTIVSGGGTTTVARV